MIVLDRIREELDLQREKTIKCILIHEISGSALQDPSTGGGILRKRGADTTLFSKSTLVNFRIDYKKCRLWGINSESTLTVWYDVAARINSMSYKDLKIVFKMQMYRLTKISICQEIHLENRFYTRPYAIPRRVACLGS